MSSRCSVIYDYDKHIYFEWDEDEFCFQFEEYARKNIKYETFAINKHEALALAYQIMTIYKCSETDLKEAWVNYEKRESKTENEPVRAKYWIEVDPETKDSTGNICWAYYPGDKPAKGYWLEVVHTGVIAQETK